MAAIQSLFGHDIAGIEATITGASPPPWVVGGDPGCLFYATDTGRLWVSQGAGVWAVVSAPGASGPGGAGSYAPLIKALTGLTDNTATNLAVVTVPNVIAGAGLAFTVVGTLGDGDSSEQSYWTAAISRVAGAVAKLTLSSKANNVNTTGAAGNAAVTLSSQAESGGATAVNTFQLQGKVARSAGTSTGHSLLCIIEVLNNLAGGVTVA